MNDINWKRCFEPAPEAFEASVRQALQTKKEEKQMKRMIPRSAVIAFAIVLVLTATALAFGGDILNFLHTDNLGNIQIQTPDVDVEYAETGILKEVQVKEAVCDGRAVHMLLTCSIDPEKGALLWGNDWDKENLPFAAERAAAPHVYTVNPLELVIETDGNSYPVWDGCHIRYDSAYSITADITFFIDDIEPGDSLTASRIIRICELIPGNNVEINECESIPVRITMPVQIADTTVYEAVNLPMELENYKVLSAKVIRTDLGCYIEVEAEDNYDADEYEESISEEGYPAMILPLHGSGGWFSLVNSDGTEIRSLTSDQKYLERHDDEWMHILIREMFPAREIGSSITIQPLDMDTLERYTPYTLELKAK